MYLEYLFLHQHTSRSCPTQNTLPKNIWLPAVVLPIMHQIFLIVDIIHHLPINKFHDALKILQSFLPLLMYLQNLVTYVPENPRQLFVNQLLHNCLHHEKHHLSEVSFRDPKQRQKLLHFWYKNQIFYTNRNNVEWAEHLKFQMAPPWLAENFSSSNRVIGLTFIIPLHLSTNISNLLRKNSVKFINSRSKPETITPSKPIIRPSGDTPFSDTSEVHPSHLPLELSTAMPHVFCQLTSSGTPTHMKLWQHVSSFLIPISSYLIS